MDFSFPSARITEELCQQSSLAGLTSVATLWLCLVYMPGFQAARKTRQQADKSGKTIGVPWNKLNPTSLQTGDWDQHLPQPIGGTAGSLLRVLYKQGLLCIKTGYVEGAREYLMQIDNSLLSLSSCNIEKFPIHQISGVFGARIPLT